MMIENKDKPEFYEIEIDDERSISFSSQTKLLNNYIAEQTPDSDKVVSAFNYLSRAVQESDRPLFNEICLDGTEPNGIVVMQLLGEVTKCISGDLKIKAKKSQRLPTKLIMTATGS
jgi:hypothetical protein